MDYRGYLPAPLDPLFPAPVTLPMSEPGGVSYPVPHTPAELRPFSATLAVRVAAVSKKHDTPNTRNATKDSTKYSDDSEYKSDSVSDTNMDS